MAAKFKVGDHVTWSLELGHMSDKTAHFAVHKGSALKKTHSKGIP